MKSSSQGSVADFTSIQLLFTPHHEYYFAKVRHVCIAVSCKLRKEIEMPLRDDPRAASYLWTGAQTPATFNEDITT